MLRTYYVCVDDGCPREVKCLHPKGYGDIFEYDGNVVEVIDVYLNQITVTII